MEKHNLLRSIIRKIIQENVIYNDGKNVPHGIKQWVKSQLGSDVPKYKIRQGESTVEIRMPWHDADRETYQFFRLENDNAIPVGNGLSRSGMESDSPQGFIAGQEKEGTVTVPEGHVLVCVGTYPKRAEIYTGQNVQHFLPNRDGGTDLSNEELVILAVTKGYKPAARPKFNEVHYANLISKGFLKANKAITVDGLNLLQDPEIKEKVRAALEWYRQKTGRYISVYLG